MTPKNMLPRNIVFNISQSILDYLYGLGVKTIFTVPGAHIDFFLVQAINDIRFKVIVASHEMGAGYMADGLARISGKPSVVITINGPGASNLITAAITAKMGHSPVIFITGDIPSYLHGYGAFQGSDAEASNKQGILGAALENSYNIADDTSLIELFELSKESLFSLPPKPIHWNLPSDIAKASISEKKIVSDYALSEHISETKEPNWLQKIPLIPGNKILLYIGDEITSYKEMERIASFSRKYTIPVVVTLGAKNIQPFIDKELFLGVFGYAGGPRAFKVMLNSKIDTLLTFGVILDERSTIAWSNDFYNPQRKIIRFSRNKNTKRKSPMTIDEIEENTMEAIDWIDRRWENHNTSIQQNVNNRNEWLKELLRIPRTSDVVIKATSCDKKGVYLGQVVSLMNTRLSPNTPLFLDSGNHRIYGGTFWEVISPNTFFSAAQTAPMGWAIGAAIGASFEDKDTQIWALTGDGCMQMHGMELAIAARYHCKVVFVVSNNLSYGRVAARLKNICEDVVEQLSTLPHISWVEFGKSLGVPGKQIATIEEFDTLIMEIENLDGPYLIDLLTDSEEPYPFLPAIFSSSPMTTNNTTYKPERTKIKE